MSLKFWLSTCTAIAFDAGSVAEAPVDGAVSATGEREAPHAAKRTSRLINPGRPCHILLICSSSMLNWTLRAPGVSAQRGRAPGPQLFDGPRCARWSGRGL